MEYNGTHANNELKPCSWVVVSYSITAGHNQFCVIVHRFACMHIYIYGVQFMSNNLQ